jgi:hypothetical protein
MQEFLTDPDDEQVSYEYIPCNIWGSHSSDYEEYRPVDVTYYIVW